MIKKMVQHGNSSALIIDKPIMELLKINPDTPLEISTDGKNIIISPVQNITRHKKLDKSLDHINKKYHRTLKKHAE
jgi:antitoxin component of MazEF toxin-antitoxin module